MNIAILIGISTYKSADALPACGFDAENMRQLLVATRKYDDIILMKDKTDAATVKDELRAFFSKYKGHDDITEALIYFSGHGLYQNDALLCCSDFDSNRPATTSISNLELDELLRSVKPEVAVKLIDACQSGSPYIKDASAGFEKALGASKLNSFICMASSRQDQSSYASHSESEFTAKWIDAAIAKEDGTIFYRDIQAALADAFASNPDQTPYFISQGSGLETFSAVTDEVKALRARRTKSRAPEPRENTIGDLISQAVKRQDQQFVSHTSVVMAIEQSKAALIAAAVSDPLVSRFYVKSVSTDAKLPSIPKARAVAEFAEKQGWDKRYFMKINTETYRVRVPKDTLAFLDATRITLSPNILGATRRDESDYVFESRTRSASIESTESIPFEVAEISYTSSHPSLPAFQTFIGIVHSLTDTFVISSTARLAQKGWSQRTPELSDIKWRFDNQQWTDVVAEPEVIWREPTLRGEALIKMFLESLAPKEEPPQPAPPSSEATSEQPPA